MPNTAPQIAQKSPFEVQVEAGKSYWWCACGKSASQPFCDGSHKGSGFAPVEFVAERDSTDLFLRLQAHGRTAALRRHSFEAMTP